MKTACALTLAIALAAPAAFAEDATPLYSQWRSPPAAPGHGYPDCFCTDSEGNRVEKGQTACLRVDGREFLARCGESQNNPAWRKVAEECGPIS